MKVYDCFIFFNELELLEIRLNEINDYVDYFVLVECTETFSKKKKELFFENNKQRFDKFLDKIIHVVVDDTPEFPGRPGRRGTFHSRHDVEWFQRDCIGRGIKNCKENDLILLSDVDEIPNVKAIEAAKKMFLDEKSTDVVTFNQDLFYYYLNGLCVMNNRKQVWHGTTATLYKNFNGAENMRKTKGRNARKIENGGWHFSFIGGVEKIKTKIESFAHAEWDNDSIKNEERLKNKLARGEDLFDRNDKPRQIYVDIDQSFPEYIQNNIEKFSNLIK